MKLIDLDAELSLKIGDFVSDGGDGGVFFADDRIKYLERAYSKLQRFMRVLMRDYQPHFVSTRTVISFVHTTNPVPVPAPVDE